MAVPVIEVNDLTRTYHVGDVDIHGLRGVSVVIHPGELSGGQQQRVAPARALINRPRLLLADEPTGNLDTRTSQDIMQTLSSLNREQGVTVVLVTHEPDIAAYADRVLTMRDGQV